MVQDAVKDLAQCSVQGEAGDEIKSAAQDTSRKEGDYFQENFDAKGYIADYYPNIKGGDVASLRKVYDHIANGKDGASFKLDITQLTDDKTLPTELVENTALLYFQQKALATILQKYYDEPINVLDVGGGPTIYQHIMIAPFVRSITHADYTSQNRDEVIAWVEGHQDSHDWRSYFRLIEALGKKDEALEKLIEASSRETGSHSPVSNQGAHWVETREILLRELLQGHVIPCDLFKSRIGLKPSQVKDAFGASDRKLITSYFVAESATADEAKWRCGMKNIFDLLEGGDLILQAFISGSQWYKNGDQKMPALSVSSEVVKEIYAQNSIEVLHCGTISGSDVDVTGYTGMIFILGKKSEGIHG